MPTLRILLIDDQPSILMLVQVMLERVLPGVRVMTAKSATDALYVLQREPCDVVLSDISMPGEDGFFVLKEVKRQWPSLPVVLMSGSPLAREAELAGADGFLLKPFNLDQFHTTLTAITALERDAIGSNCNYLA
ncbi:MAG TPA: response regulator [Nitrospiraceae bacterium]|nr:response regulator [Nitrospiraceae bacterium]